MHHPDLRGDRCRAAKIREVLGPTDPAKAPPGSIRREFGSTIMVNAAHASDSPDNARREMGNREDPRQQLQIPDRKFFIEINAQKAGLCPPVMLLIAIPIHP